MHTPSESDRAWPVGTLLHRLQPHDRHDLLSSGVQRRAPTGTVLLRMGAPGSTVLLVLRAFVKVTVPTPTGREALLAIRVPGDLVGEVAVLNHQPRPATVTTCGDAIVRVIDRHQLQTFLAKHPAAAIQLAGMVADRLRWANERRVDATAFPVPARLARILSYMAATYGVRTLAGIEIGVDLTQSEISTLIGVSEITVQRTLRNLRVNGLITTGYRRIVVSDLPGLRSLGNCD